MAKLSERALEARRRLLNGHYVRVVMEGRREVGRECPRCGRKFPRRGSLRGPSCRESVVAGVLGS